MRLVIILFAESRDLLPRDNPLYYESYGLDGLFRQLEHRERRRDPLAESFAAWPRILALCRLVRDGSHHPDMPLNAYGGELFAAGEPDSEEGVSRALTIFESACFERRALPDSDVYRIMQCLTRTTIRIRQGRRSIKVPVPVDFSDLSSEYIGVLYEGLLDYELKTAPPDDPVIFLAVGDQPALPLQALEAMEDSALKALFEDIGKAKNVTDDDERDDEASDSQDAREPEPETTLSGLDGTKTDQDSVPDERQLHRTRAETWARRAAVAAGLVRRHRGRRSAQRQIALDQELNETAQRLVGRVVLPSEWYLIRWGGTRKGSGSFYTRPGLPGPTVQRTLRPLAYDPPAGSDGTPDIDAPPVQWTPKHPEEILRLTVCDPACGSGMFPLAALRFLTDALYASVQHHDRIRPDGNRSLVHLLGLNADSGPDDEYLGDELIPCRPDTDNFEARLKAVLRRHVVERCLYAVDLDPIAVELCRLSLWIETMDRNLPFRFLDHKIKCGNSLIGTWFDYFRHYPAMAWKHREGGDRSHSNGVHFNKNARTQAIKEFVKEKLTPDLRLFLQGGDLFHQDLRAKAAKAHSDTFAALRTMHTLPAEDVLGRSRIYRNDFLGSTSWQALKEAMDLWCACWFWPVDEINCAPVPTNFLNPPDDTREVARRVAAEMRFFHWELEFPDVFRNKGSGFNAVLANPPWDTAKPFSKEFFTNIDPLYRSYGKQEALRRQAGYFKDPQVERRWLDYNARFRALSNFVSFAASPFGDPEDHEDSRSRFTIARKLENIELHKKWRKARIQSNCFCDSSHPFRHQGSADLNLFKLFLESTHSLLQCHQNSPKAQPQRGGRLGIIVPSALYSDNGTQALRELLLKHCQWSWLFGIENRERVFPIHGSYKFNPVIIEKGGHTSTIQTVFMRRDTHDWERAESLATPYHITQIERFSPKNYAILEIQSLEDIEILEKIYSSGFLLGDRDSKGWNIHYSCEFHTTNDSRIFPSLPNWESIGYRADEYNRWILGRWCSIDELWKVLGVDTCYTETVESVSQMLDSSAGIERIHTDTRLANIRSAGAGDIAQSNWQVRCARPPYDELPVPRARIPAGVILSRDGKSWIRENEIKNIALPFYEGRMINQFDFSDKGWVRGKGRTAEWRDVPWKNKMVFPQYLMENTDFLARTGSAIRPKIAYINVTSSTNTRSVISSFLDSMPVGNSAPTFYSLDPGIPLALNGVFNSLVFDFITRFRLTGLNLNYHILEQNSLPDIGGSAIFQYIVELSARLSLSSQVFSTHHIYLNSSSGMPKTRPCLSEAERARILAMLDAILAVSYSLGYVDVKRIIRDCDFPINALKDRKVRTKMDPKGFWRVDQDKHPELRQTILMLVAFRDLESKIEAVGGSKEMGVKAFFSQNHGEGWLLPESLRLSDYGLGHDERAKSDQPVAGQLGPRFYDWQLAQDAEEFWKECHLHSRNLLGVCGYSSFLAEVAERRINDDGDGLGMLADEFARELICVDSHATVLAGIYERQLIAPEDYWRTVRSLHEKGHLSEAHYKRLLDICTSAKPHRNESTASTDGGLNRAETDQDSVDVEQSGDAPSVEIIKQEQRDLFE